MQYVLIVVVLAVISSGPYLSRLHRGHKATKAASHYRLRPAGKIPDDLVATGASVRSALGTLAGRVFSQPIVTVHWYKGEGGEVKLGLVVVDKKPDLVAGQLARALNCALEAVDHLDLPAPRVLRYGRRVRFDPMSGEESTIAGFGAWMSQSLAATEGDAIFSVGLSPMLKWEAQRLRTWLTMITLSSLGAGARFAGAAKNAADASKFSSLRGRVIVAADDASDAENLIGTLGQLPDFSQEVVARPISDLLVMVPISVYFVVAGMVGALTHLFRHQPGALGLFAMYSAIGACLLVIGEARVLQVVERTWRSWQQQGVVVPERPWYGPRWQIVGAARAKFRNENPELEGSKKRQARVCHPDTRRTVTFDPRQVATLLHPGHPLSTVADRSGVTQVLAPPAVRQLTEGAPLGCDASGAWVRLPWADRFRGLVALGDPGTGKSTLLLRLLKSDLRRRRARTGAGRMTIITIDPKGEFSTRGLRVAEALGYQDDELLSFYAAATIGPRLELFDRTDPVRGAAAFMEAMKSAFEPGAIKDQSAAALLAVLQTSLAITPDISEAMGMGAKHNVMFIVAILLGNHDNPKAQEMLFGELRKHADQKEAEIADGTSAPVAAGGFNEATFGIAPEGGIEAMLSTTRNRRHPLSVALDALEVYMNKDKRERAAIFEAPRNKVAQLVKATALWQPSVDRADITLDQILGWNACAFFNFGPSDHGSYTREEADRLAGITLYLLWDRVKLLCSGWQGQGRSIGVYCDELGAVSNSPTAARVMAELREQGRSFGVQLCLGTQQIDQLPPEVQKPILTLGCKAYFRLENLELAQRACSDLTSDIPGSFVTTDIRTMPELTAAVRTQVNGVVQPPFTIQVPVDDQPDPDDTPMVYPSLAD